MYRVWIIPQKCECSEHDDNENPDDSDLFDEEDEEEIDYKIDRDNEEKKKSIMSIPIQTLNKFKERVLYSERGEYRVLKAVFGIVVGIALGFLIYLSLKYAFKHETTTAWYIASGCTLILCVGVLFSVKCRCICSLMIPNFFTKKGRVMYLSAVTGLILAGPILNITKNIQETSRSIQCSADLFGNLTNQLQEMVHEPFRDVTRSFKDIQDALEDATKDSTKPIQSVQKQISKLKGVYTDVVQICRSAMGSVIGSCSTVCRGIPDTPDIPDIPDIPGIPDKPEIPKIPKIPGIGRKRRMEPRYRPESFKMPSQFNSFTRKIRKFRPQKIKGEHKEDKFEWEWSYIPSNRKQDNGNKIKRYETRNTHELKPKDTKPVEDHDQ
ncbi:hypothetical protein ScPMuIL_016555 [Solemya velum]